MSLLRDELETAARSYAAAKYPGDLAADVLGPATVQIGPDLQPAATRRARPWLGDAMTNLVGGLAAAAAVALAVWVVRQGDGPTSHRGGGMMGGASAMFDLSNFELPSIDKLGGMSLMPPSGMLHWPSMPIWGAPPNDPMHGATPDRAMHADREAT